MSQVEVLKSEIEYLSTRRSKLEKLLAQPETAASNVEKENWRNEMASIIDQMKYKQEQIDTINGAAVAAVAAVEAEQESVVIEGISLRDMFLSPTHYEFYLLWRKQVAGEEAAAQASATAALESSYKSEIESHEQTIAELEDRIEDLNEVHASAARLQMVIEDLENKRHAAGEKITELEGEVERLTKDNESLREQLKTKPSSVPTNTSANLAEMAKQILAAKPGIYNKRWKDENRKTHYIATLSETGEEIEIPFLEIGKYREETPEAAEAFRQQKAAEEAAKLAEQNLNLGIDPPAFRDEEETATVPEHPVYGEMDDAPVTRSEIRAIEERLLRLEQQERVRGAA